jgi:hypothetical protein
MSRRLPLVVVAGVSPAGGSASPKNASPARTDGIYVRRDSRDYFANALRTTRSTLRKPFNSSTSVPRTQLVRPLEMFFGQVSHTKILEPAPNHPMEKGIIGRELVGLPFMTAGFFEFA